VNTAELQAIRERDAVRWREGALWLEIVNGWATVKIERNGQWVEVLRNFHGHHTSHIVEPAGINAAIDAPLSIAGSQP
jgi:hypothetical protein